MIFVDTGPWFALVVESDPQFASMNRFVRRNRAPLITTDFVIDETLTLLRARGKHHRAIDLGSQFFEGSLARIEYLSRRDIAAAWRIFRDYADKGWSFTDCTSKVVIERLKIRQALSLDAHFRQFGSVTVLP